ncbi:NAD-dependent protein deacetylase sirtuin-3 isoform X2 [Syngnathoides biaculeatus]|uniref:NAD-dependent protein deacetylase sirtuin-3 isoform X2 n=1 Tax=Syngnathoides biaculeatus TaxID=300417 RepID=UPI002ADE49B8|nr:NAD-dependent protein deacetylase sirtuin-3 isoform X2 [Syngnathoides biaculeatus]
MSGSKSKEDDGSSRPAVARITRSSRSTESRDSGPGQYGKQRKKQLHSALTQDLSQMSVSGQGSPTPSEGKQLGQRHDGPALGKCGGGLASVARRMKIGRCRNIVVVAGAGISTPSGIPDFRTPGTGLYANLEAFNIPYPEAIFNVDYFSNDPQPFFSLAKVLYPGSHRPNYIHFFIRMLHHKGLLLRMYTQNIDGLEKLCGIPDDKLVEGHGSFATASCHLCYTPYPSEEAKRAIMSGDIPTCTFCAATVKPDVVFFGEDLPQKYFLHTKDFPKADLLIIMGTSLQIEPFASLVNTVRATVPRLLLNRHPVGPFQRIPLRRGDHMELGDLENTVRKFAEMLGWHDDIVELMKSQEQQCIATVGGRSGTCSEESDSETDSKCSASSCPSN